MKNIGIQLEIGNNSQERQYEKVVDNKLGNIFFKCKLCGKKSTSRPGMNAHLLSAHDHSEPTIEKVLHKCDFVSGYRKFVCFLVRKAS